MEFLLTFFFLVAAHNFDFDFFPWKTHSPIRLIINYVIGTVGMLAPFVWWLFQNGETEIIIRLFGFVVAAGLAPVLTHWTDHHKRTKRTAKESKEHVTVLEKQLQDRRDEA